MSQEEINLLRALKPFLEEKQQTVAEHFIDFLEILAEPKAQAALKLFNHQWVRDEVLQMEATPRANLISIVFIFLVLIFLLKFLVG